VACFGRNLSEVVVSCCISSPFGELSTTRGEITYVLLTRAPLYWGRSPFTHDLHVLGAPLTFVLSQDQTLQFESFGRRSRLSRTSPLMLAICTASDRHPGDGLDPDGARTHAISRVQSDSVFKDRGEVFLPSGPRNLVPVEASVNDSFGIFSVSSAVGPGLCLWRGSGRSPRRGVLPSARGG
jgi:hypothetical protein